LLFPENIGELLSLDETEMSNGELYTILTNKSAKGKQGSIVARAKSHFYKNRLFKSLFKTIK